jgi:hypothetical protein
MQRKFCNMFVFLSTFHFTSAVRKQADPEIKKGKNAVEISQERKESAYLCTRLEQRVYKLRYKYSSTGCLKFVKDYWC